MVSAPNAPNAERTRREDRRSKFYEISDNLVEAALAAIESELAVGGEVSITGFGRFSTAQRTGEPIDVPAGRAPRFAPGSQLKGAVARA